jgi:prepilin-type N-terminal cleavage/methylation domain-containing protein
MLPQSPILLRIAEGRSMTTAFIVSPSPPPRRAAGFTLIELMITVLIVAILAAIAIPSYRNYVIRGQLVDATNGLSGLRANMERYYQDNRTYMSTGAYTSPCLVAGLTSGTFTLTCTGTGAPTLTTYVLTATGSANTAGFVYTVDQQNNEATTVTSPPAPTSFTGCTTNWVTKTGGC